MEVVEFFNNCSKIKLRAWRTLNQIKKNAMNLHTIKLYSDQKTTLDNCLVLSKRGGKVKLLKVLEVQAVDFSIHYTLTERKKH